MSVIAAGLVFICTPTLVADGDGPVWCSEGPHVRLAGISARELDGTCRPGHPCPRAGPIEARDALVALLGGSRGQVRLPNATITHIRIRAESMRCLSIGPASGNRTGAFCTLTDGRDLSCAMLATGSVARWDRYWRHGPRCRN